MAFLTRRKLLGLSLAALASIAASAAAHSSGRTAERTGPYGLRLEDAGGASLPSYFHEGRWFVLGEKGERYTIVLSNPTSERVEAVVSVDGRDAISGRVASYRSGRGYIVPAHGSVKVEGFRRSLGEVASFRFVDPARSYSARLGTRQNVGVVGVAFFREKIRAHVPARPLRDDWRSRGELLNDWRPTDEEESARAPAKGAARGSSASAPRDTEGTQPTSRRRDFHEKRAPRQLGTEYGETRESPVVEVPFERRSRTPETLITLNYDSAAGLTARGIDVGLDGDALVTREPEAFPDSRFAAPP